MNDAVLMLKNGSIYKGISAGINGEKIGWVSFYTGIVGYQEVISSPVNAGRILVMTYPLIGNYGTAKKFMESKQAWANGLIIKEESRIDSNWQSEENFKDFLKKNNILCIQDIDTRTLMVELREKGEQFGIISTKDFDKKNLKNKINKLRNKKTYNLSEISVKKITKLKTKQSLSVGILDIGVTNSLINQLKDLKCKITVLPYKTNHNEISKQGLNKLIISDGPEMDKELSLVSNTLKSLIGKIPILGIGAGCHVLAKALGADIKKMHLGHHGLNYPVIKSDSLKGKITEQNHSFGIDEDSLNDKDIKVTWRNLNDNTIEGIENKKLKVTGYQFSLSSPGLGEANSFLKEFVYDIDTR